MFVELEPLLADRTLVLTISAIDHHNIRVNVIPKSRSQNDSAEKALTMPLSITGSAAELDRELPMQLAGYTEAILQTGSTLQQVQEAHKAALKEIEVENRKALESKRKISGPKTPSKTEEKSPPEKAETPSPVGSLFDDPPAAGPADQPDSPIAKTGNAGGNNASEKDAAAAV